MAQRRSGGRNRRESRRALAVSVALHVIIGVGLVRVLLLPGPVRNWLGLGKESRPQEEHIRYLATPALPLPSTPARQAPSPAQQAPPPPGGGPRIVAPPTSVPTTVAPAPAKPAPAAEVEGVGPIARTGGPGAGARMEYHGRGVWVPPVPAGTGEQPRSVASQLDSAAHAMIARNNDSLAKLGPTRRPGDWTKTIGGKKWGMDQQYIHLGPISIPNAVLAALPLNNFTGNPIAAENERLINSRSADIQYQANRQIDAEEMNKAIKEERLRKEREHEQQQKPNSQPQPPAQNGTPTVANSGGGAPSQ